MKTPATTIGAFEAKTKLGELLERVRQGADFTITKHEQPVARLVGIEAERATERMAATMELRALRSRYTLAGLNIRDLKDAGRA
jgi:prevent-host-death family protein